MLSVDEARRIVAEKTQPVRPQRAGLYGNMGALGSVLAEVIRTDEASPRFDRALVDGYALRSADAVIGAEFEVIGRVDAGAPGFSGAVGPGQCVAINTGGMMPAGADAVLMVEHIEKLGEKSRKAGREWVRANRAVAAESGVQRRGAEAQAGSVVLEPGVRMGPGQIAACAAAGAGMPLVRRITVGVLTTGDELVDPPETAESRPALASGHIWNSNRPMLCSLVQQAGAVAIDLGNCPDDARMLERMLDEGLERHDLLVISGGMSMGTKDLAPGLLRTLGVEMHIEKVRMKPGKPFLFGSVERRDGGGGGGEGDGGAVKKYVAGLPGNPLSAFVTFERFVREIIDRLAGAANPGPLQIQAVLSGALAENGDRDFYLPCRLLQRGTATVAEPLMWKGSGSALCLGQANGLIVRAAGAPPLVNGQTVDVIVTGG